MMGMAGSPSDTLSLTDEDISSIKYFITEKGDITKWVGWDTKKSLVQKQFPQLIKALSDLEIAERMLKAVVDSLYLED